MNFLNHTHTHITCGLKPMGIPVSVPNPTAQDYLDPTEDNVFDYGLHLIQYVLMASGKTLQQCPEIPLPQWDWDVIIPTRGGNVWFRTVVQSKVCAQGRTEPMVWLQVWDGQ